jgi:hypothetical protein
MGMLGNKMPPVQDGRLDRLEKMLEGLMGVITTRGTGKPTGGGAEENGWSRGAETAGEGNGRGQRKERLVTHREKNVLVFQCTQRHLPVGDGMFLCVNDPLGLKKGFI